MEDTKDREDKLEDLDSAMALPEEPEDEIEEDEIDAETLAEQEERELRELRERREARARQQDHSLREWISDNLRYILLILAIAVVVVVIVLGVKLFSDHLSGDGQQTVSSVSEDSKAGDGDSAGKATVSPEAEKDETVTPTASVTPTATPTPTVNPTATPTETPAATPTQEPDQLERARSAVSEVVEKYFEALGAGDVDSLSAYVEELTEEDKTAVTNNQQVGNYSNLVVYSYTGPQENSYIVFASYTYQYQGYDTEVPGLTQLYLFQKEDGKLCIASEDTEAGVEAYINQVLEREDIQKLIAEVSSQYDQVMNDHPDLKAYVESLG